MSTVRCATTTIRYAAMQQLLLSLHSQQVGGVAGSAVHIRPSVDSILSTAVLPVRRQRIAKIILKLEILW